jgi:hypothetical protein
MCLYVFFWVIPRRLNFVCRRFGTLCLFHLHRLEPTFSCINTLTILKPSYYSSYLPAYEDGTDRVFRNVGIQNSDAGELPRRKHTPFTTRRKFEIKDKCVSFLSIRYVQLNHFNPLKSICPRIPQDAVSYCPIILTHVQASLPFTRKERFHFISNGLYDQKLISMSEATMY